MRRVETAYDGQGNAYLVTTYDGGVTYQATDVTGSAGRLVGYLTSRETAPIIGRRSMGSSRASGWNVIPLIRMTNVNLRPGDAGTLDDFTYPGGTAGPLPGIETVEPAFGLPARLTRFSRRPARSRPARADAPAASTP